MTEETVVVAPEQAGGRLDKLLAEALEGMTRSGVQKLMEEVIFQKIFVEH